MAVTAVCAHSGHSGRQKWYTNASNANTLSCLLMLFHCFHWPYVRQLMLFNNTFHLQELGTGERADMSDALDICHLFNDLQRTMWHCICAKRRAHSMHSQWTAPETQSHKLLFSCRCLCRAPLIPYLVGRKSPALIHHKYRTANSICYQTEALSVTTNYTHTL